MKLTSTLALATLLASFTLALAGPINYQSPLSDNINHGELRLIQYSNDAPPKWMTENDINTLLRLGIKFMDITDYLDLGIESELHESLANWKPFIPTSPAYEDEVKSFIGNLTTDTMKVNLQEFTSFRNRYYKSSYGLESCKWLYRQVSDIIAGGDADSVDVSVRKFIHSWDQFTIIARFEGTNADKNDEVVIVGAHQDSVNMWMPSFGRAPGADDDGSGAITILEAFRVLVDGGFRPERSVEFHWYSAEESGLLGSQAVALNYQKSGRKVVAMLQNDMTGFVGPNGEVMGIVTDFVDSKLSEFVRKLIETYGAIPWKNTKCGYGCSDHASWTKAGYASAFAIESTFEDSNKLIHTSDDTLDHLSFDHMKEFSKLSVSFAIEMSHIREQ